MRDARRHPVSRKKQQVRSAFRDGCFRRDGYRCVCCGFQSSPERAEQELDAHHITDRNEMPNGGYVKENGATLCKVGNDCHLKAEQYHLTGSAEPGYAPQDLYAKIGSSHKKAIEKAVEAAGS